MLLLVEDVDVVDADVGLLGITVADGAELDGAAWYMRTGESLAVEQAGDPALDGRHRALSADTLAIDDLARAAGTQAVEE